MTNLYKGVFFIKPNPDCKKKLKQMNMFQNDKKFVI